MAIQPLGLASTRADKTKSYQFSRRPNRISFWAFLVSIFIYISIFYIFNLSPSTLFASPKFWFSISNTLILIIAADSGAFSAKESHPDIYYHEYLVIYNTPRPRNSNPPPPPPPLLEAEKSITPVVPEVEKNVVVHETKLAIVPVENDAKRPNEFTTEETGGTDHYDEGEKVGARRVHRSKSDKMVSAMNMNKKKIVLRRSETEAAKIQQPEAEESDEFSRMSDEELNRRIEEFIEKFNRQIRESRCQ